MRFGRSWNGSRRRQRRSGACSRERSKNGGFIIGTAVELAAHDDEIERLVAAVWRAVEYLFGTLIEEGQSAGEIAASVDPIEAGRALVGLYLGLGVHVLSGEPASGVVMQQVQAVLPAPGRR